MRRERQVICFLIALLLLSVTTDRLPAPIVEEATPKAKRTVEAAPKRKERAKPAPTPKVSFAGTWSGTVTISSGEAAQWRLAVSADERRIVESGSGVSLTYSCYRQGNALVISGSDELGQKANGTLQFAQGGAVIFRQTTSAQILFFGASMSYSGTLFREGGQ